MPGKKLPPALEMVVHAKRQYVKERKAKTPIEAIRALASMQRRPPPVLSTVSDEQHVMLVGQIRHTPANGMFDAGVSYDPVASALHCVHRGVDAISLFTDQTVYLGGLDDLVLVSRAVTIPVITQDHILDEYQIIEARAAGAAALVLSATVLEPSELRTLLSTTQRNRMTALVQVHSREELDYALSISPLVIGISAINLDTAAEDLDIVRDLRPRIDTRARVMVMDGVHTLQDVAFLARLGVDAIMLEETMLASAETVEQARALLADHT